MGAAAEDVAVAVVVAVEKAEIALAACLAHLVKLLRERHVEKGEGERYV